MYHLAITNELLDGTSLTFPFLSHQPWFSSHLLTTVSTSREGCILVIFVFLVPGAQWMLVGQIKNKCTECKLGVQFSLAQSCPTLCNPVNRRTPGLPVHHQLPESTQTHVHRVSDDNKPSHPLSSPSPPAPNPSQYQGLFQLVNSSHEVAKVLEFQLQHQSF